LGLPLLPLEDAEAVMLADLSVLTDDLWARQLQHVSSRVPKPNILRNVRRFILTDCSTQVASRQPTYMDRADSSLTGGIVSRSFSLALLLESKK
jgi:hypothetical protein